VQDKSGLSRAACLVHACKVNSFDSYDSVKPVILQSLFVFPASCGIASLLAASWPLLQEPHSLSTALKIIVILILLIIIKIINNNNNNNNNRHTHNNNNSFTINNQILIIMTTTIG